MDAANLRPRAEYLRQLPTLATETATQGSESLQEYARQVGVDYLLELKLETATHRYWLCTKGAERPGAFPKNWVVGYVTMDPLEPDENGERDQLAYGPDDVDWLQGLDYFNYLLSERNRLQESVEQNLSWETDKEVETVENEIQAVSDVLRSNRPRS